MKDENQVDEVIATENEEPIEGDVDRAFHFMAVVDISLELFLHPTRLHSPIVDVPGGLLFHFVNILSELGVGPGER